MTASNGWTALTLSLLSLVTILACTANPRFEDLSTYPPHYVPLPDLPRDGTYLRAVDFALDQDRVIHCVAAITFGPPGAPTGTSFYYVRGMPSASGWAWAPPLMLLKEEAKGAHVIVAGRNVHVMTGAHLRHWVSEDAGATWMDKGALVPGDSARARIADLASVGDTMLVAYITWLRPGGYGEFPIATKLHVARWTPGDSISNRLITYYPVGSRATPGPRLAAVGGTIHLVAGIRDEPQDWSAGTGVPLLAHGSIMQFDYHRSDDAGRSWTRFDPIPLEKEWDLGAYGKVGDVGPGLPDLALAANTDGASAFWGLTALHRHRLEGASAWGPGREISARPIREPGPSTGLRSIQTIACAEGDAAIWISPVHVRPLIDLDFGMGDSGRGWTDILVASFPASRPKRVRMTQLRDETTYTQTVRARAYGDSLYILRGGFDAAGENRSDYNPARNLSFYCLPLHSVF